MNEVEAQIKRYKDSIDQHQYRIESEVIRGRGYDKICIDRNRMMIKDLKSIFKLVEHLR